MDTKKTEYFSRNKTLKLLTEMTGNQIFKTILFPTDFSEASLRGLNYAVGLALACQAELIILHTFRLIGSVDDSENMLEAKRKIELRAAENFKAFEEKNLKATGLHYKYLSEIGFISDRIISNMKIFGIDLLVLCENTQMQIKEKSEKGYQGILSRATCPVMLIPVAVTDYNHLTH